MSFREDATLEQKALYYTPFVVAPLSFFSSIYVCYLILRTSNRPNLIRRPRDQLLLGMSLLDILASFGLSFSTTPAPALLTELNDEVGLPTYGTVQTCTAQGVFAQMAVGVPMYNAAICIYYLLSIRYRVSDRKLMRWLVPTAHFLNFSFVVGTAIVGITLKLFNYAGYLGCWFGTGNRMCSYDPRYCDRGYRAKDFELYFGIIPLTSCFCIVIISMIVIFVTVRRIERRNRRWDFALSVVPEDTITSSNPHRRAGSLEEGTSMTRSVEGGGSGGSGTTAPAGSSPPRNNSTTNIIPKMPLTRRTMESGLLYSGVFLLVYFPLTLTAISSLQDLNGTLYKTLRVLAVIFFPLQGFFNMLIFTSHVWIKWLKQPSRQWCRRRDGAVRRNDPSTNIEIEEDVGELVARRGGGMEPFSDYEESLDFFAVKRMVNPDSEEYQQIGTTNQGSRSTSFFRVNTTRQSLGLVDPFQRSGSNDGTTCSNARASPGSRRASWSSFPRRGLPPFAPGVSPAEMLNDHENSHGGRAKDLQEQDDPNFCPSTILACSAETIARMHDFVESGSSSTIDNGSNHQRGSRNVVEPLDGLTPTTSLRPTSSTLPPAPFVVQTSERGTSVHGRRADNETPQQGQSPVSSRHRRQLSLSSSLSDSKCEIGEDP